MNIQPQMYLQHVLCCTLVCAVAIYGSNFKGESKSLSDLIKSFEGDVTHLLHKIPEKFNLYPDSVVLREKRQYVDEVVSSSLWYSYRFGTGTGNREVLKVSGIRKENWLGQECNGNGVWSWKSLEVSRNRGLLLGLGLSSLTLCSYRASYYGSDPKEEKLGYYGTEFKLEIPGIPTAAEMFQTWNETSKRTDVIVVVAIDFDKRPTLVWCRVVMSNERPILVQLPNTWDLHKSVWNLLSFKINSDRKLLVLNLPEDGRRDSSVDFYGFILEDEGKMDFWLVQKLFVHAASSVAVINVGERVFLGISQPDEGAVNIYVFDQIDNKFKGFQEIEAPGVGDLVSFYVGFSSFVAVAGKKPMLLRYDKEEFVVEYIDGIDRLGLVLNWLPIPIHTYRNEVVLIVETEEDKNEKMLSVVTWIGGHPGFSVKEPPTCYIDDLVEQGLSCVSNPVIDGEVNIGLESAAAISLGRLNPSLIIARPNGPSALFRLEAHLVSVQSPVEKEIALLRDQKLQINAVIDKQLNTIKTARTALEEMLEQSDDMLITGSWKIPSLETLKLTFTDSGSHFLNNLEDLKSWKFGNLNWRLRKDPSLQMNSLESKVEGFASSIREIQSNIDDAVPLVWNDNESVIISAPHTFEGTISVGGTLAIEDFQINRLDGVEVKEILSNTVRLDKKMTISGHKVIKTLSVDNLQIINKLGATDVSALVFADDEHVMIEGATYKKVLKVYGDVLIPEGGTLNGLNLSEDVVTVNGTYDFMIGFVDGISSEEVWTSKMNEFPLDKDFFDSIMREDSANDEMMMTKSALLITNLEADGERVEIKNINGRNFWDILSKVVFLNAGGSIPEETYAKECHARLNTHVSSLNKLSFPDEFLMHKGNQVITGRKSFLSSNKESMKTDNLEISGLINGLNTGDLITLSADQNLKNTSFRFTDLDVQHLQVFENIDIPVENYKEPPLLGESKEMQLDLFFEDIEINGSIIIKGSLNDKDWKNFIGGIVYDDNKDIIVEASKIIIKDLIAGSLHLEGMINELDVSGFLTKDSDQTFVGRKAIGGNTVINNFEVEDSLVGGIDLKYLSENAVRISVQSVGNEEYDAKSEIHSIDGHLIFEDEIISSSFQTAVVNDLDHQEAAFLSKDQEFMGGVEFNALEADSVFVEGSFHTKQNLSGLNLREFDEGRFSLTKPQLIDENADVYIRNAFIGEDLETDLINNKNINDLDVSSLIYSESEPNINYQIERMTVNGVVKTDRIGAYNLQEIQDSAIWINKENYIEGEIIFIDGLDATSVNVIQTVNGYDLNTFLEDVVLKGEKIVLGHAEFVAGLKVGDVITSSLNGKPIESVLTTNTYQEINESFRIKGDVLIDDKMALENGKINGFEILALTDRYQWRNGVHVLKGDVILEDSTKIEELIVVGLVNTVDWGDFLELATLVNDHVEFTGNVTFENKVLINDNFYITKTIDEVDFEGIFGPRGTAVLLNHKGMASNRLSYGVVDGLVRFKDDVVVNNIIHVYGDMTAESVYGCDLEEWTREAIYLDRSNYVTGIKVFNLLKAESPMEVGILNNIVLDNMISLSEIHQELLKQLNFKYLTITEDREVAVGISVNGYNLMEEYKNTLLMKGDQLISGQKIFKNIIKFQDDIITNGTINYVAVGDIVTLQTEQNITGLIEAGNIVSKQDVQALGFVNEKDFIHWTDLGVKKDCSMSKVLGTWSIKGNVTFRDKILGEGTLDGVDVSLYRELGSIESNTHQKTFTQIKSNLVNFCKNLKYIEERVINQPVLFKELEAVQNIQPRHDILTLFSFSVFDNIYLVVTYSDKCGGEIHIWDSEEATFNFAEYLSFAGGSEWHYLGSTKDNALLVVGSQDWRECEQSGYNVWRFDPHRLQFEHIQSIGNIKSSKVLIENSIEGNLLYTFEDEGIYQWILNKAGDYLEKSQYFNVTEFLNLRHENDCMTTLMAKYIETGSMNDEDIRKLIHGFDKYVILNISANLTLGAQIVSENTMVRGSTDYIEVYNLYNGSLFTKLPCFNPTSLIAIDFGHNKQKMLAFIENNRSLKMYEYEGIGGFKEHLSFRAKFSHLSSVSVRVANLLSPLNFILASNKTHIIVFKAEVFGDPLDQRQSFECSVV